MNEKEQEKVIEALKVAETLRTKLKKQDHLITARDTEIQALLNKVTVLEKCNREVFMELDQSVNQQNLLNKSAMTDVNLSNIISSPNKPLPESAVGKSKLFDTTFEIKELVNPLKKPEPIRKSNDGAFVEK